MIGILFWIAVGMVVYTYVGYPALLFAVSRLRKAPAAGGDHTPALTLVIAAYNEEDVIGAKLAQSLDLEYPTDRLQVIVAADGSDDRTVEIASEFADRGVLVLHRPERKGKLAAITRAVAAATGEIIVFSDANNRYEPQALMEMARPFADPTVGAVSGRKAVLAEDALGFSENLYWRYESAIKRWETRLGCTVGVNGEIIATRRDLFRTPPAWVINDDTWLARLILRKGLRIVYAEKAISVERVSATATDELERRSRMVAGQIQVLLRPRELPRRRPLITWQFISHKLLRPLVPLWMAAALAANVAALAFPGSGAGWAAPLTLATPWNLVLLGGQAAFYGLALAGDRLPRRLGRLAYVPRFLWDSNRAAIRGLIRLTSGKQTALWEKVARRDEAELLG